MLPCELASFEIGSSSYYYFMIIIIIIIGNETEHDHYETGKKQDTGKMMTKNKTKLLLL